MVIFSSKDMPQAEAGIALLQLFHAVNSLWPGQAGLLATKEGQAAAFPAFDLAVVLLEQAARLNRPSKGQRINPLATAAVKTAVDAAALLVRQLSNRMHHSRQSMRSSLEEEQHETFEQQLVDKPAVLHILLLLAGMQLQRLTSSSSSTSSCSHSTSTDGAGANAVQQYHKQLLPSFRGLSEDLWQESFRGESATAAEGQQLHLMSVLGVLQAALRRLEARCESDGSDSVALPDDPRDFISCSLLPRLMSALTHTVQQQWQAGSFELAAAAVEAVQEASKSLSLLADSCRGSCEDCTADRITAAAGPVMHLAYEQQQLMPGLLEDLVGCMELLAYQASAPSAVVCNTGGIQDCGNCSSHVTDTTNHPSSRTDSSAERDSLQAKLLGCLLLAAGRASDTAFGDLPGTAGAAECSTNIASPHKQVTAARVVECSLRTVAHAAAGGVDSELISGIAALLDGGLCTLGLPTKLPSPAAYWQINRPEEQCHEKSKRFPVQQTTAASAGQSSVEASDLFTDAAHKGLFSLLVSSLKLAQPADDICVLDKVESIVSVLMNDAVKTSQQAAKGAPPMSLSQVQAAPWLVVMARCMILEAEALKRSDVLSSTPHTSVDEAASKAEEIATAFCSNAVALLETIKLLESVQRVCDCFGLFEAAACCAQVAPAAAAGLQQELTVFWQSLEEQLLPELKLAVEIARCTAAPRNESEALQQQLSNSLIVSELLGQLQTADTAIAQHNILSNSFIAQLPLKLKTAAQQLCVLLPLPLCCNNPDCSNMSMQSELQLVGGKSCVCAQCEVARYCGRECQAAHWQAHKRVCKMIKKSSLATATASTAAVVRDHPGDS